MPDRTYYQSHRAKILEQVKAWRKANLDKVSEYNAAYRSRNPGKMSEYRRKNRVKTAARVAKWKEENLGRWNENKRVAWKRRSKRDKIAAMQHYGGKCKCCGESNIGFLTLDHINGDGAARRREIKVVGADFYVWLRRNNYPGGLQVLCWNCNCGRHMNGGICPHAGLLSGSFTEQIGGLWVNSRLERV